MAIIVLILGGFVLFFCVTTIDPGMIGIVFHERGKTDPAGHFIVEKGYKGVQREVLEPGLHFFPMTILYRNPIQSHHCSCYLIDHCFLLECTGPGPDYHRIYKIAVIKQSAFK